MGLGVPIPNAKSCFPESLTGYNAPVRCVHKGQEMGLQISSRKAGAVTILDLKGRVTIGSSNDALSAELRKLAENAPCDVVVNLAGVTQMDSSGISTLVRSFVTLERQGGGLKLLNPAGHVLEVLDLTRLIQSIPTFKSESAALASFRGGIAAP